MTRLDACSEHPLPDLGGQPVVVIQRRDVQDTLAPQPLVTAVPCTDFRAFQNGRQRVGINRLPVLLDPLHRRPALVCRFKLKRVGKVSSLDLEAVGPVSHETSHFLDAGQFLTGHTGILKDQQQSDMLAHFKQIQLGDSFAPRPAYALSDV